MSATFFRLLLFIPLLLACNRDDKLPEESDTGKDTFGMYIDDRLWTPYVPSAVTALVSKAPQLYYYRNSGELLIEAQRIGDKNGRGYFNLVARISGPGEFRVAQRVYGREDNCGVRTQYSDTGICRSPYFLIDSASSRFTVTKLDTAKKIVSGTFALQLKDSLHRTINIRNGRFDSHYSLLE